MGYQNSSSASKAALAAFALLLLAGQITAATLPWNNAADCFGTPFSAGISQNSLLFTTFGIVIFIVALAYMLGQAIEKPELVFWSKTEAYNLAISAILVLGIVLAFGGGCTLLSMQSGGAAAPFETIKEFVSAVERGHGLELTRSLVSDSMDSQMRSVSYFYWSVPVLGGKGIAYRASWRAIAQHMEMVADIHMPLLVSLEIQKMIFDMMDMAIFGALLPAAVVLRTFFPTRDVGNFLIALSFGVYLAFPFTYLVAHQAFSDVDIYSGFQDDGSYAMGSALKRVGYVATAAILLPNIALVVALSFTMAGTKALRGLGS